MSCAPMPPGDEEFELCLIGPGYGESIVMHIGGGTWIVVDSCLDSNETPQAVRYLQDIGVEPAEGIKLIVATHWHDDHIRGVSSMVDMCPKARFCCAAALGCKEFLTLVGALEGRHASGLRSGLREIYGVFSRLKQTRRQPVYALANRTVFQQGRCKLWSISPSDHAFQHFLRSTAALIPDIGETRTRAPNLPPNDAAVVLWVDLGGFALLLGSDLEQRGWVAILGDSARPARKAAAFKVPHHGSKGADESAVWQQMLKPGPIAVLTPWCLGGRSLPGKQDIERILACTPNAFISSGSAKSHAQRPGHRKRMVARTLRESGVRIRRLAPGSGRVQLRRPIGSNTQWRVETFGDACHLTDYTA